MGRFDDLTEWKIGDAAIYFKFDATRNSATKYKTKCVIIKVCKNRMHVQFADGSTAYVNPENLMRIDETNRR